MTCPVRVIALLSYLILEFVHPAPLILLAQKADRSAYLDLGIQAYQLLNFTLTRLIYDFIGTKSLPGTTGC